MRVLADFLYFVWHIYEYMLTLLTWRGFEAVNEAMSELQACYAAMSELQECNFLLPESKHTSKHTQHKCLFPIHVPVSKAY